MQNKKLFQAFMILGAGVVFGVLIKKPLIGIMIGAGVAIAYFFNVRPKR